MQLDNILFTNTVFGSMLCLLIGLTVIRAKSISLRSFQAIYLLLGAANVALCYFVYPTVDILFPIAALAAGIFLTFIAAGIFGKFETSAHYETILVAVGLFPWYLGLESSLAYVVAVIVFCGAVKLTAMISGVNAVKHPLTSIFKMAKILPADKLTIYREKAFVILTTPVGFAGIFGALAFAIQF